MPLSIPLPNTTLAIHEAAVLVQTAWVAAADALTIAPPQRQRYVLGLMTPQSLEHPYQGDMLQARVVNVAKEAARIEFGTRAIHLPTAIRWAQSRAARRSKAGRYYLRVPFRHGAFRRGGQSSPAVQRAMLPQRVYRVARHLRAGQRLTAGPTRGQALHAGGMQPYVPRHVANRWPGVTHAARQEGLRRGRQGRGSYVTFRTMTADSPGWWIPPRPGVQLAAQVRQATLPQVQALLEDAIRQDVEAAVRHQLGG